MAKLVLGGCGRLKNVEQLCVRQRRSVHKWMIGERGWRTGLGREVSKSEHMVRWMAKLVHLHSRSLMVVEGKIPSNCVYGQVGACALAWRSWRLGICGRPRISVRM